MKRAQRLFVGAAALGATLAYLALPALSQELTADEVLAKARAAAGAGTKPPSERERWDVAEGGVRGTLERLVRGDDYASVLTLGPLRQARGKAHGQSWHQSENGVTVLEQPQPSQTEKLVSRAVARVEQPVPAFVVTSTYASGHVWRNYYDPGTFLQLRAERVLAGRTYYTEYGDFRTDAFGRTTFWHYDGGSDKPEDAFDFTLRAQTFGDVSDSDIALPENRRKLLAFPDGVHTVRLPARFVNDRIYVRLWEGDRGLDFLLDTGAADIVFDQNVGKELGLQTFGEHSSAGGSFTARDALIPSLGFGPIVMHDVVVSLGPFAMNEAPDTEVVGLLGFDFLASAVFRIDYKNATVDAIDPATFAPPATASFLSVRLNDQQPITNVSVNGTQSEDFLIDTGAPGTYALLQRFFLLHGKSESDFVKGESHGLIGTTEGLTAVKPATVRAFVLGDYTFTDLDGLVVESKRAFGTDVEDGVVGSELLRFFNVYLDYSRGRIYLEPNGTAPK